MKIALNIEEVLVMKMIDKKNYKEITEHFKISHNELVNIWKNNIELRNVINRSNKTFNRKKSNPEFKEFAEIGRKEFYNWYKIQKKECYYCGISEYELNKLFNGVTPVLISKRKRGKSLELDRKNANNINNVYSIENCVLACYICNNHKSDLITAEDFNKYFSNPIKLFYDDKLIIAKQ